MKQKNVQPTESVWTSLAGYVKKMLCAIVTVYMFLIIAVMPFYFQEGYNHIGSDKSYFFRTCTKYAARVFLVFLALYLILLSADLLCAFGGKRRMTKRGEAARKLRFSVTDIFAAGYAISVILAYIFSDYRDTALWGSDGWYMGMIPQLMLVGIYFAVSRLSIRNDVMIYLFLAVSAVVFALGCLNRFGIWPLSMENSGRPDFISTIGNINWYCGYLTAVLFLGTGLFWLSSGRKRLWTGLCAAYMAVGFATLATQGSDSGIFAFALVMTVLFVLSAKQTAANGSELAGGIRRFWQIMLTFSLTCLAICTVRGIFPESLEMTMDIGNLLTYGVLPPAMTAVSAVMLSLSYFVRGEGQAKAYNILAWVVRILTPAAVLLFAGMIALNTLRPGSLGGLSGMDVFTFDAGWGSNRGATWGAGVKCYLEQSLPHKITGVGPDCMWDYIHQNGSSDLKELVRSTFGIGNRLTNAHCELLTVLVNTGIFGFVSYAGMMISAIVRYIGKRRETPVTAACGLCLLTYCANGLWSFQQSMGVATVFVILGIGEARARNAKKLASAPIK